MRNLHTRYNKRTSIHYVLLISTFWAVSDALVSFYLPIQIQQYLHNLALLGIIFALFTAAGIAGDLWLGILSSKIKYTVYLAIGLLASIILVFSALLPFTFILIVWLMVIWGAYYEFIQMALFNYITRHKHPDEYASNFGIIYLFQNLSYVIGPLIGGFLVIRGKFSIYSICLACILIASAFLFPLIKLHRYKEKPMLVYEKKITFNLKKELKSIKKVWHIAFIMFIGIFLFNVWDSFVWTLGPLQGTVSNVIFAGVITAVFTFPLALLEGYGGKIADKYGKRITFIIGFFIASLFTFLFGMQDSVFVKIFMALIASTGFAFAYPAMMGETSNISANNRKELGNITGLQRIFVNMGYIFGPLFGGILGNIVGIQRAFAVLGFLMICSCVPVVALMFHAHMTGKVHKVLHVEFDL